MVESGKDSKCALRLL